MMWSEKYRPKNFLEMIGNEEAKTNFVNWIKNWVKGTKPLLLVGPPGIGKTTMAILGAKIFGFDMISLNASDVRTKKRIQEILNPVMGTQTILGKPMIFVDEVDGIHGRSDYGGVEALVEILKEPTVPIVLAANSESADKMKSIKKVSTLVRMRPLPPRLMRFYLEDVLGREKTSLNIGTTIKLVLKSKGDIRSMLNSAQAHVFGFEPQMDRSFETTDVESAINSFFKAKSIEEAKLILYSLRIDPQEKINAFYSSVITSPISRDLMHDMLEVISEADVLYGKIRRHQNWRLLRYIDPVLIRLYKSGTGVRYSQYNLSWPILNRIRWDGKSIKQLVSFLGASMHVSRSVFVAFYLPYLLLCIKNKRLDLSLSESQKETIEKELELMK